MIERIVITGIGVVSPIGHDRESFWNGCLEGRSGARLVDSEWTRDTDLDTRIASQVVGFDSRERGVPGKLASVLDPVSQMAIVAAEEALRDAGFTLQPLPGSKVQLELADVDSTRIATVVGSGIGGLSSIEQSHGLWREDRSKKRVKRYSLPMLIPNAPAGQVSIRFRARGESKALSTACAAGTMSIGEGCRLLDTGIADVVIAGGAEAVANDADAYGLMGFDRLRTLSQRNDDPQAASRPFDKDRDGFVLGEGAGILILEREAQARARGARIYAGIDGYACNSDAHSMMQIDPSGETVVALMRSALAAAGVDPSAVGYISAHGTSTVLNDKIESMAIRKMFGSRADEIHVTALKSMTGHGIGASGSLETAALALSLQRGQLTPTINYETPDPECDVNVVANRPLEARPSHALKMSYGFGGHNACLVLSRSD